MKSLRWIWLSLIILSTGCQSNPQITLNISAASSLQEALQELTTQYETLYPNIKINLNFGGSNVLKTQILEGFDVDLYLSANETQYKELEDSGYIQCGQAFLKNEIVLVSNTERIQKLEDLDQDQINLIFANESVPIGAYTMKLLETLHNEGILNQHNVLQSVVSYEENVRQVLTKLSLGVGDAGFVYQTDVISVKPDNLTVILLPLDYQLSGEYYIGILKKSTKMEAAEALYDYILSEAGKEVFHKYGFNKN